MEKKGGLFCILSVSYMFSYLNIHSYGLYAVPLSWLSGVKHY